MIYIYSWSIDAAYEAVVLFVVFDFFSLISEFGEGIDNDSRHDVGEEQRKEHVVQRVEEELQGIPIGHAVADHSGGGERDHATDERVAVVLGFILQVDLVDVVIEPRHGEHEHEQDTEHGHHKQLLRVVRDGLEDVLQQRESALVV